MAVQKNKKSRSKRGMRRAHQSLSSGTLSINELGATHRRHHIASDGTYRGKQVIVKKEKVVEETQDNQENT